jgi:hypothetical protein
LGVVSYQGHPSAPVERSGSLRRWPLCRCRAWHVLEGRETPRKNAALAMQRPGGLTPQAFNRASRAFWWRCSNVLPALHACNLPTLLPTNQALSWGHSPTNWARSSSSTSVPHVSRQPCIGSDPCKAPALVPTHRRPPHFAFGDACTAQDGSVVFAFCTLHHVHVFTLWAGCHRYLWGFPCAVGSVPARRSYG